MYRCANPHVAEGDQVNGMDKVLDVADDFDGQGGASFNPDCREFRYYSLNFP